MTLIKDLIHIPEKVQRGDFVLNLRSDNVYTSNSSCLVSATIKYE